MSTVLVTGGSGFIGSHSILQLLAAGHRVRTTVRNLERAGEVRAMLRQGGAEPGDCMSILDMAKVLRRRMGASAKKVPTFQLPNWLVRIVALRDPLARSIVPELGRVKNASHEKAKRVLGWTPRSNEEAIVATGESLVRLGIVQ